MLLDVLENSIRKETQGFGQFQVDREERSKTHCQDETYLQKRLRQEKEQPE